MDCFKMHGNSSKASAKCTASTFKELRGLSEIDAEYVLGKVLREEIPISKLNRESKKLKQMKEVQEQLLHTLAIETWSEFCERYTNIVYENKWKIDLDLLSGNTICCFLFTYVAKILFFTGIPGIQPGKD